MSIAPAPPRPRLSLRLGFAGNQTLPEDPSGLLVTQLKGIFAAIDGQLAAVAPGIPDPPLPERLAHVASYYCCEQAPLTRLVTGLADGADRIAAETFLASEGSHVERELAAVISFDRETYRDKRSNVDKKAFNKLHGQCAYVIEADGRFTSGDKLSHVRHLGYGAQAALLLRQSDLLIAIDAEGQGGKPGGTKSTVEAALRFKLPVVYIDASKIEKGKARIQLLRSVEEFERFTARLENPDTTPWADELAEIVRIIVAGPDQRESQSPHHSDHHLDPHEILDEYFGVPGRALDRLESPGVIGLCSRFCYGKIWKYFQDEFRYHFLTPGERKRETEGKETYPRNPKEEVERRDAVVPAIDRYRKRAGTLNYLYSDLYRGAFFSNFILATAAVLLAALSLVVLTLSKGHPHGLTLAFLLALALAKIAAVVVILRSTKIGGRHGWNDKAIDTRFIAERLRAMYYLPRVGSLQPPASGASQYASRALHQSAIDWLVDAIVRDLPPLELMDVEGVERDGKTLRLRPVEALEVVKENWVGAQTDYNRRVIRTQSRIEHWFESWAAWLNYGVIAVVAVDILGLLMLFSHSYPEWLEKPLHLVAPWLVFIAAVLPAAVAALNGIRFQSECRRLADRSAVVVQILAARDKQIADILEQFEKESGTDKDRGSWCLPALAATEALARDMVEDVAEWSVLYAKEMPEI